MEANDPRAGSVQRILLAEDDEDMRRFLVKALEKADGGGGEGAGGTIEETAGERRGVGEGGGTV